MVVCSSTCIEDSSVSRRQAPDDNDGGDLYTHTTSVMVAFDSARYSLHTQ